MQSVQKNMIIASTFESLIRKAININRTKCVFGITAIM